MKLVLVLALAALPNLAGCDTDAPTMIVVDDDYPAIAEGGNSMNETTVYKVWWVTSFLPDPVAPGEEGQPERTVPNTDFAYAVLAPGWDPSRPTAPLRLLAAKSATQLTVARGDTLHVHVSDDTFVGNCGAGKPLTQDEADFITTRIFPGDFAGLTYDAATCSATRVSADAGENTAMSDAAVLEETAAPDAISGVSDAAAE
jgi:hypothetical protein